MDLDEFMARSNARARRGRRVARQLFVLTVLFLGLFAYALSEWITAVFIPWSLTSMMVLGLFLLLIATGLAWMVRILRAHHEPETGAWRYRDS
jgi:protein-S-isoprenylcysteine O-methyltransferase Ste14